MSASACVAFYGLRFEIPPEEIESLEMRSDRRMQAARKAGLRHYWANFGLPGERYLLFVGTNLGILGPEHELEVSLALEQLQPLLDATREKLRAAGFSDPPCLHLQWQEDL